MKETSNDLLDPVAAYDRLAPFFPDIAERRKQYLDSIDALTIAKIPSGSRSLLDVGAGDGKRALQIAGKAGLSDVVLLEPSLGMMGAGARVARVWRSRAEDMRLQGPEGSDRRFDVITCLWNVLGHIRPAETRARVLGQLGRMLPPNGRLFLDVNHRYNARSYGPFRTAGRFLYDRLWPSESNGDVSVRWTLGDLDCRTYGHVFTDREIRRLAMEANLVVAERVVVDYDTGEEKPHGWEGNLFYVLRRRASINDSCNTVQTSCTSASVI